MDLQPLHPFPARMAPDLAMKGLKGSSGQRLVVLDPMCGSGTALTEAAMVGHFPIGIDFDPLAVTLTNCALDPVEESDLANAGEVVLSQSRRRKGKAQLKEASSTTREFVDYWFDADATAELAALAEAISEIQFTPTRRALWCAFSRMIIVKSGGVSRARDLSHSRPHRAYDFGPSRPFDRFPKEVDRVGKRSRALRDALPLDQTGIALRGDARAMPIGPESVDIVICSPPYLNAIDYIRTSKFTLVWMGHRLHELREVRSHSVGSEAGGGARLRSDLPAEMLQDLNGLEPRYQSIVARYATDLLEFAHELKRVLKSAGQFTLIVGNSTLRGVYVKNSELLKWSLSKVGLLLVSEILREIPDNRRYLPPPSTQKDQTPRMREEVVISGMRP